MTTQVKEKKIIFCTIFYGTNKLTIIISTMIKLAFLDNFPRKIIEKLF